MKKINLFGAYLQKKRQEKNITLRELASKTGVSHTYLYNIEKGQKAPPNDSVLIKMIHALSLDVAEKKQMFDIAAKDMQQRDQYNFYAPVDIIKYLSETENACEFIRKADELNYTDEYWIDLLKKL